MKAMKRTALLSIILLLAPAVLAGGAWEAGLAEIDITPPAGFRMAGYFDERFSTGTHDPLKAKALVLRQGRTEVALVFCDLVGMTLRESRPAREKASRLTGIPVTNIVIACTHSHTGPLFDEVRNDYFHRQALERYGTDIHEKLDYPKFLIDRMARVVAEAHANLRTAELDSAVGTQKGLPFNRRYHMRNGTVVTNPGKLNTNIVRVAGPVDRDVDILMIKDAKSGKPEGGLTVFAMHADTTGGTLFSADYPYYIEQSLRKAFGPDYISAFGAGTSGDLNHIDVSKGGLLRGAEIARGLGESVAATVLENVPHLQAMNRPALAVRSRTLMVPLQTTTPRDVAEAKVIFARMRDLKMDYLIKVRAVKAVDLSQMGTNYPVEVQVFRLDEDNAIVCLPAEIFVELGLAIKQASPFKNTTVIEICNDRPSYMPTLKAFAEGSYETINSRLKPGDGEMMVEAAIKMLNQLKRDL